MVLATDEIENIKSRLKVLEVLTRTEGTIIIAMDPMKNETSRPYAQQFDPSGKPTWVDNPPDIPGYTVAVGETLAHAYVRDSLEAADIAAAYALLDKSANTVTEARSYSVNAQKSGTQQSAGSCVDPGVDTGVSTGIGVGPVSPSDSLDHGTMQISRGILTGFTVLAHWRESATNKFYSLALTQ